MAAWHIPEGTEHKTDFENREHTLHVMNRVEFELNYGQGQCKYYVYGSRATVSDYLAV
jgi:hypothetical protein